MSDVDICGTHGGNEGIGKITVGAEIRISYRAPEHRLPAVPMSINQARNHYHATRIDDLRGGANRRLYILESRLLGRH